MVEKDLELTDIYQLARFGSGLEMFFLLFYTPLGLVLAIFRFFLALQLLVAFSFLKKTWLVTRVLLKVCGAVLGIVVTSEGKEHLHKEKIKIIISNNVTMMDNVAMEIATPCIVAPGSSGCMKFLENTFNDGTGGIEMKLDDFETKLPGILATDPSVSFLSFPEEANSSEKSAGLLKFSSWPFGILDTVVPALITTSRLSYPPIYHSVIRSHWISELFWFFFVPYTHFHIRFLPSVTKQEDQTKEEFCRHVEKIMASTLGLQTTVFTSLDKVIYAIKLKRDEELSQQTQGQTSSQSSSPSRRKKQVRNGDSPSCDTRLNKMATQVKEVLPQVPLGAIKYDLGKTHCVDTTITNIIEGRVSYTPEDPTQKPSTSSQTALSSPPKATNAANSFSKSSEKRQQSFEERKRNMIEEARRRYIAKHGL